MARNTKEVLSPMMAGSTSEILISSDGQKYLRNVRLTYDGQKYFRNDNLTYDGGKESQR
jgi:hypothetical protein